MEKETKNTFIKYAIFNTKLQRYVTGDATSYLECYEDEPMLLFDTIQEASSIVYHFDWEPLEIHEVKQTIITEVINTVINN